MSAKKITDSQAKEIVKSYESGETVPNLAKIYNVGTTNVYNQLKRFGVKMRPSGTPKGMHNYRGKLSKEDVEEAIKLYREDVGLDSIAEKLNVHRDTVYKMLKSHQTKMKSIAESHRLYKCNHSFFSDLNPTSAYWAGFIAGDGNIQIRPHGQNSPILQITLAEKDESHLEKFKEALSSEHIISTQKAKTSSSQDSKSLVIASTQLCSDLALHYNVYARKTYNWEWPAHLPTELQVHFLRGLFDADGCWSIGKTKGNEKPKIEWEITGCITALEKAQELLMKNCQLSKTKLHRKKSNKCNERIAGLRYTGGRQVVRIFEFMYKNATIWLERKRNKIEPYLDFPSEYCHKCLLWLSK